MEIAARESLEANAAAGVPPRTRRLPRPFVAAALIVGAMFVVLAAIGPSLLVGPNAQDLAHTLQPPLGLHGGSASHLLGTDLLGRDLLSRTVSALQTSLIAAVAALAIGAIVGVAIGMTAGYVGGIVDEVVMRIVDVQLAVPGIVFVMLIIAILQPTLLTMIGVLALIAWVVFARVARAQVLSLREQDMVVAVRAMGATHARVLLRHVLPNIAGPLLVIATVELANLVIVQAALSYLGLGVPPPTPTLGGMIFDGQSQLAAHIWWPVLIPACFIVLLIAAANVTGDWLRDILDPRARAH
jgi:peptide/nickel transport system permease protein